MMGLHSLQSRKFYFFLSSVLYLFYNDQKKSESSRVLKLPIKCWGQNDNILSRLFALHAVDLG